MSLKRNVTIGVKWSSISQFGRQGMQLVTTVILARLLSPSDFGLASMAMVVIGFVFMFRDLGTSSAIIRQEGLSEELLSSIFWVNVAFGLLVTITLYFFAPLAAGFYHEPRVAPVLKLLAISLLISSLGVLHQSILERDLSFNKLAKIEVASVIVGSVVGIGSAVMGYGVWSLVYQTLTSVIMTTLLLWLSSSWRPKFIFRWLEIKSIGSYSLSLVGFNIVNYFARNIDNLLIGRFLGAQSLGYYNLAYRIMLYPLQSISTVISRVTFPAYSKLQEDNDKFRYAYLDVVRSIALFTFPLMLGLTALSRLLIFTFFGSQWSPSIILLIILAPVGLVQSIGTTVGSVYQAKGRTALMLIWGIGASLLTIIAIIVGLQWGIIGVAAAYATISIILTYPGFAIPCKLINLPVNDIGKAIWPILLGSSLMAIVLFLLGPSFSKHASSGTTLAILILIGVSMYILLNWLINRDQLRRMLDTLGARP